MTGDVAKDDGEVALFHVIEGLLNEKHVAPSWNYSNTADEVVDAVVAAGWRPGGVPARPTREALTAVLFIANYPGLNSDEWPNEFEAMAFHADALLAADHLWAEQPNALVAALREFYDLGEGITWKDLQVILAMEGVEQPSTLVVDLEALAKTIRFLEHNGEYEHCASCESRAESLIAAGLYVDRATVEAEQREKDAQTADGQKAIWGHSQRGYPKLTAETIASLIRSGPVA